jgi:predicted ATP-grasp superfamily ATP-dependent carboligase
MGEQTGYLLRLADEHALDGWALFPTGDETAALVARNASALAERYTLTTPPWEVLRLAYDKRLTHRLAASVDVECPWTVYPRSRADLEALQCPFPIILKPATKETMNRFTAAKAWRVDDREELLARYDEACTLVPADTLMVQELVPGGGDEQLSFAALCVQGRPLASIAARRLRQYPMDFGRASCYVESMAETDIEEPARRILAAMRFTGLIEVEFKRDARTGRCKLLDVNGRVWGWHTLGRRAGVDFPYFLWRLVNGEPVPERRGAGGVRWVRTSTDLPTAMREIFRRRLALRAYLASLRGPVEAAIFAKDDPLPGILEGPLLALLAGRRIAKTATAP